MKDMSGHKPSRLKKIGISLLVVVILLAIAGGVYEGFLKHDKKKPIAKVATTNTTLSASDVKLPSPTKQYYSDNSGDGFNYPSTWSVSEPQNSNQITLTSTILKLPNKSGKMVDGKIVLTIIETNPASLGAFNAGSALAVLPSQVINYSNPTQEQQGSAYVSFLQYASTNSSSPVIDSIYITGNNGYQLNQYIPQSDVLAVNPIIYFSFLGCANTSCSTTSPISLPTSIWKDASFSGPILSMLESLSLN
jgi:hypothetical protein